MKVIREIWAYFRPLMEKANEENKDTHAHYYYPYNPTTKTYNDIKDIMIDIDNEMVIQLLNDVPILKQDVLPPEMVDYSGPVLMCSEVAGAKAIVSVWSGNWLSLMINTTEKDILRAKLGIPFEHELAEAKA